MPKAKQQEQPAEDFLSSLMPKDPVTGRIMQNNRQMAKALIERFCNKAKISETLGTAHVMSTIINIAREFTVMVESRDMEIKRLQTQVAMQQEAIKETVAKTQAQMDEVTTKLKAMEAQLDESQNARFAAEFELQNKSGGLQGAQDAAIHAINECALLAQVRHAAAAKTSSAPLKDLQHSHGAHVMNLDTEQPLVGIECANMQWCRLARWPMAGGGGAC